jgi:hypothetical protein
VAIPFRFPAIRARNRRRLLVAFAGLWLGFVPPHSAGADDFPRMDLSPEWGGHLRGQVHLSRPPGDSVSRTVGGGTFVDAAAELRLKNRLFFGNWGTLETHYEVLGIQSETRKRTRALRNLPELARDGGDGRASLSFGDGDEATDDRRFLNLTRTLGEGEDWLVRHRLDRLVFSIRTERGAALRIGRQALTWGNGLIFNPMDLFNPFAPTDVLRDYKAGDDMALVRLPAGSFGEFQAVYVPRRNPANGHLSREESALGSRIHFVRGALEFDLTAGWNRENLVVGAGVAGYLGGAAWRADLIHTRLPKESRRSGYVSAVVNLDHSWTMWGWNGYGFLEFFHGGLGDDDPAAAATDPDLAEALARGERFTLGRNYLAGQVRLEIHPLVNLLLTAIHNAGDSSSVFQPRVVWSMAENLDLLAGANLYRGGRDSEFGGFRIPGVRGEIAPAPGVYGWLTWYF